MTEAHPEDFCQRCGGRNPTWSVDSDRFNTAVNRSEIVCPTCFVFAHEEATGMTCAWSLVPGTPFKWIEDAGRPTPFLAAHAGGDDVAELERLIQQLTAEQGVYRRAHEEGDHGVTPNTLCRLCQPKQTEAR